MTLSEAGKVIAGWCELDSCIEKAWIFGSRARGTHSESSDIDVAIQVRPRLRFETTESAMFHERVQWNEDLQLLLPWTLHLCRYEPAADIRTHSEGICHIKHAVESEGILVFDRKAQAA